MLPVGSTLVNLIPPSELQAFCPACPSLRPGRGPLLLQASLMRFAAPSALKVKASTNRGLTSAASFRPRRFSRPRRLTPLSTAPGSPWVALVGFRCPSRLLPLRSGLRRLRPCHPLSTFQLRLSAFPRAPGPKTVHFRRSQGPQGLPCGATVPANFWFPIRRGPSPSWTFSLEPRFRCHPKVAPAVRFPSRSDLSMSSPAAPCREKLDRPPKRCKGLQSRFSTGVENPNVPEGLERQFVSLSVEVPRTRCRSVMVGERLHPARTSSCSQLPEITTS